MMIDLMKQLANDDAGFVVSAELVLVGTIAVLAMVVGLAEVANNVNQELEDLGSAFGSISQSYSYCLNRGHKGWVTGSCYHDRADFCDREGDIRGSHPVPEKRGGGRN